MLRATVLRLLFPSWAFFDVAGASPVLEIRQCRPNGTVGPWLPVVRAEPRRWWQMVFNPSGTRTLAEQTLVERLSTELQALDADAALDAPMNAAVRESMMLVAHVAESRVPLQWRSDADARWQWHIVMLHDGGDLECYCSPAIR